MDKPDKIIRDVTTMGFSMGGLKMTHLENHIIAVKARWINRLLCTTSPWVNLFQATILNDLKQITDFGPNYGNFLKLKTSNVFWIDVLTAWTKLTNQLKIQSNLQLASTPIWYNKKLTTEIMFLPKLYKKGIAMVSDVIDSEGKMLTRQMLKSHYNLDSLNFLEYIQLSTVISKFIKKNKNVEFQKIIGPIMPTNRWMLTRNTTKRLLSNII